MFYSVCCYIHSKVETYFFLPIIFEKNVYTTHNFLGEIFFLNLKN